MFENFLKFESEERMRIVEKKWIKLNVTLNFKVYYSQSNENVIDNLSKAVDLFQKIH